MVSLEKSLMSCPLDQTTVSRDMDALPFKRKGKLPNSHADNMSDKQVHPSTPLPHLVLPSLEETQESNWLCLSSATIGTEVHFGKSLPPNPTPLDIHICPLCMFPGFVFLEEHSPRGA